LREETKSYLWIACLVVVFGCIFSPVWGSLIAAWVESEDYSHGFLIVPLALYILWQNKATYRRVQCRPCWGAFPIVVIALLLYLLASYAEIKTLASLSMILFIGTSVLYLAGMKVFRLSLFPLILLLFMVPVPSQIYATLTIPLQLFVTKLTVLISSGLGVPVLREGNVIFLPEHTLQVVQACSGLRSIMSLLTLGAVIGYFGLKSRSLQWILFLSAIPIAIFVNIVRVFSMVGSFYYFDYDLSHGVVHTYFGVFIFVIAVLLFLLMWKGLNLCDR
jgi:exosortase